MTATLERIDTSETAGRKSLSPFARAVSKYLDTQIEAILDGDAGLRRGDDPIHDTRVAIRRLRSTLRVFGRVFDPTAADSMEADLKWFAGLLGEVRDCQVQARRFHEAVTALPDDLVLGPVHARIRDDLRGIEVPARDRVAEAMTSPRHLSMLAELRRWIYDPPMARDLKHSPDRQGGRAGIPEGGPSTCGSTALHRRRIAAPCRKAAKRARYAAELLEQGSGSKSAKRKVKHYKKIQSTLGDFQDTVVATPILRQLGAAAGTTTGENGFTFGLLYAREQQIARECREAADGLA